MIKNKLKKTLPNDVLNSEVSLAPKGEQKEPTPSYVVVRNGVRVSDKEYSKADEPRAVAERDFWKAAVNRHPDGTKIEIVQYDKKKHRIW
jgi:hypothetical protein